MRCPVANLIVYVIVATWRSRNPLSRVTSICPVPYQVEIGDMLTGQFGNRNRSFAQAGIERG